MILPKSVKTHSGASAEELAARTISCETSSTSSMPVAALVNQYARTQISTLAARGANALWKRSTAGVSVTSTTARRVSLPYRTDWLKLDCHSSTISLLIPIGLKAEAC